MTKLFQINLLLVAEIRSGIVSLSLFNELRVDFAPLFFFYNGSRE